MCCCTRCCARAAGQRAHPGRSGATAGGAGPTAAGAAPRTAPGPRPTLSFSGTGLGWRRRGARPTPPTPPPTPTPTPTPTPPLHRRPNRHHTPSPSQPPHPTGWRRRGARPAGCCPRAGGGGPKSSCTRPFPHAFTLSSPGLRGGVSCRTTPPWFKSCTTRYYLPRPP
jgi:hypothetical protein